MAKPAVAETKHEFAYKLIRERIHTSIYRPGQRLVMDELARDLHMSQVPIREAVRRLEAEGWLTYRRNSGPEVANVSQSGLESTIELLAVLEGFATAQAAPHMTADDIAQLRDQTRAMHTALEAFDLVGYSGSARAFHLTILARCTNAVLVARLTDLQNQLEAIHGTMFPSLPQRGPAAVAEHEALAALLATDAPFQAIESAARGHKLNFLRVANSEVQQPQGANQAYSIRDVLSSSC